MSVFESISNKQNNFEEVVTMLVCKVCGEEFEGEVSIVDGKEVAICEECLECKYIQCEDCEEYFSKDNIVYVEDDKSFLCNDCIEENDNYVFCRECEEWHLKNYSVYDEVNNNWVCDDCMSDMVYCRECGEIVMEYDAIYVSYKEEFVCNYCLDENYDQCTECGEWFKADSLYTGNNENIRVCDSCYNESYCTCESCGDLISFDDAYSDECGYYCAECYEEEGIGVIRQYHDGHEDGLWFFDTDVHRGGKEGNLYIGYELEVDKGNDKLNTVKKICEEVGTKFLHFENDGSLDNGFEIISQPATLEYHINNKDNHEKMTRILTDNGFRSHDTGTCGLHCHINRNFFTEEEVAKLLYIVSNTWEDLAVFSRRTESCLNRWAKKYGTNDADMDYLVNLSKSQRERYYAVNLQNRNTLELRLFKGTLNNDTFYATLQLVDTLARAVKKHSLVELQTMTLADVVKETNHEELLQYCVNKGITK